MTSSATNAAVYPVPKGWTLYTAGQIRSPEPNSCVAGPFGSKISSKYFVDDGVPVVRGGNLRDDLTRFVPQGFVFVSEARAQEYRPQHVRGGDLVFTCWGTIGQVGLVPEDGPFPEYIISNKQLKLRVNRTIADPRFCFYYFASPRYAEYIRNRGIGGAVPGINLGILKSLVIALPSIEVQGRITDILSAYDDLVENNRRRMTLLEEAARQLYRDWFVRLRFPGHEHTRISNGVPEGWERKPVDQLSRFLNRGIAPQYDDDADGLVINQKCIRDGRLDLTSARHQSREFKPDRQIQPGDVLVNSTGEGTLGRVAQVLAPIANCTVDTHVTIVRPTFEAGIHYFGQALIEWEPRFSTMGRGATNQTELSRSQIGAAELLLPSRALLQQFEDFADPALRQVATLMEQNERLRIARDLLLPRLMSGEIAV
jgi:type I restriction enzyme S subunit